MTSPELSPNTEAKVDELFGLLDRANELHADHGTFIDFYKTFREDELVRLWNVVSRPDFAYPFDGAVYDALSGGYGYFDSEPRRLKDYSEAELMEVIADFEASVTPRGHLAMHEYLDRRAKVLDRAMERNRLEQEIKDKFAHLSDAELMRRMAHAPDFGYDDEEVELTRRLKERGLTWRWISANGRDFVEVYQPEGEV